MSKKRRFKGGPPWKHSGGRGPDDYVLKPIEGGRWHFVIFRWGRNWTGSKEAAESDQEAMKKIFPLQQIHTAANYQVYHRLKRSGRLEKMTISATDFWKKYGDDEVESSGPSANVIGLQRLKDRIDKFVGMDSMLETFGEDEATLHYETPTGITLFSIELYTVGVDSWRICGHSGMLSGTWKQLCSLHKD